MPSRRSVLAVVGTTAMAGCMSSISSIGNNGFPLGAVWVTNGSDEPQDLSLVIEQGDETVYDNTIELGTEPGENIEELDPTWSSDPSTYTLSYGLVDAEMQTFELTAEDDETEGDDCMFVHINIHPAGDVPGYSLSPASEHPWNPSCP